MRVHFNRSLFNIIVKLKFFWGNGFCRNDQDQKIGGTDIAWEEASVREGGSSSTCEDLCFDEEECVGYLTKDFHLCSLILSSNIII